MNLPATPLPMGRYVSAVAHNGTVITAGMTPRRDGVLEFRGVLGRDLSDDDGADAARLAATNALAAAAAAAGGIHRLTRLLSMTVYVVCAEGYTSLRRIADAASDALSQALAGVTADPRLARAAIAVASLPDGAPVEIQLQAAYEPSQPDPGASVE